MWEAIESNKRKSSALIGLLLVLLVALGAAIGGSISPQLPLVGAGAAAFIWVGLMLTNLAAGESVLLGSAGARKVERADAPQLFNVVEEMQIANGMPHRPDIYIIDSSVPNAFAVGLKPERSAVAVTTGLLANLRRDELQGVIAHELAHIQNRDTLFMTLAGVTLGAAIMLADFYLRHIRFTSPRTRRSENNQGAVIMAIVALVLAILAPLLARLLYFACSRKREYLADACSARATRYPEGLANALDRIRQNQNRTSLPVNRTLAPMYIVNPLAAEGGSGSWFSTHPPTDSRIQVLLGMAGEFSFTAYERVFRKITNQPGVIDPRSLEAEQTPPPIPETESHPDEDPAEAWRETKEILHRVNGFFLIPCICGARLKLPPDFDDQQVRCPHCGRSHAVDADFAAAATTVGAADKLLGGTST